MKRISDESGIEAGWRNIGRLALFSIPYALGAGALIWLGFFMAAHDWFNILSQEQRRAIYVGAEQRPKSKLEILTPQRGCIRITRVDLEGSAASVYFKNECQMKTKYMEVHWQLIAPDQTALASGWRFSDMLNGPSGLDPGQSGEAVFSGWSSEIKTDNRAKSISFWIEH